MRCKPRNNLPPLIFAIFAVGMKTQNLMDAKADIARLFSCVRYNRMIDWAKFERMQKWQSTEKGKIFWMRNILGLQ